MESRDMSSNEGSSAIKLKVALLGDQAVGKSSIFNRYFYQTFKAQSSPTVGVDFVFKQIKRGETSIRLQLWDTAGQQRYSCLIPNYLKNIQIAIVVMDMSSQRSFQRMQNWLNMIQNNSPVECTVGLAVNKCDLKSQFFDQKYCSEIQNKYKRKLFIVSAKTGEGVSNLFNSLIDRTLNLNLQLQLTHSQPQLLELNKSRVQTARERCNC